VAIILGFRQFKDCHEKRNVQHGPRRSRFRRTSPSDAVRRLGNVEVAALAGSSLERTERKAAELGVQKTYGNYEDLIANIYEWVRSGGPRPSRDSTVSNFASATRIAALIEAMLESNRTQTWQTISSRSRS
jgi:predicted dehydrogenase